MESSFESCGLVNTISFLVTDVCNLRCKYCYLGDKRKKVGSDDYSMVIPSAKELLRIYEGKKIRSLRVYGAEPTTVPANILVEAINILKPLLYENGGAIDITTNGTLCTKEYIDYFVQNCKSPVRWTVSIDGPEYITDKYRGRGTYIKAMQGLFNIRERGYNVRVQSVYSDELLVDTNVFEQWEQMIRNLGFRIGFLWRRGLPQIPNDIQERFADYCIETNRLYKELRNHKGVPFCYMKDNLNARYHVNGIVEMCHLFDNNIKKEYRNKSLKEITISLTEEPLKQVKTCKNCIAWDYCKGLCPLDKPYVDVKCGFLKRVFERLCVDGKTVDDVMNEVKV